MSDLISFFSAASSESLSEAEKSSVKANVLAFCRMSSKLLVIEKSVTRNEIASFAAAHSRDSFTMPEDTSSSLSLLYGSNLYSHLKPFVVS